MPRFDIYGRFVLAIRREHGRWAAYRLGNGTRRPESTLVLPDELTEAELPTYLDDIYHEYAVAGRVIRRLQG